MYLRIKNNDIKYPYNLGTFRKEYSYISLPKVLSNDLLKEYGIFPVKETTAPDYDNLTHKLVRNTPAFNNSEWEEVWSIEELSEDIASSNIRNKRDKLLTQSDWTQLEDSPVNKQIWNIYRQSLRDVPSQIGFPYSIEWPSIEV